MPAGSASILHANGHSLSQSMESINTIGLSDDEVRRTDAEKIGIPNQITTWSHRLRRR